MTNHVIEHDKTNGIHALHNGDQWTIQKGAHVTYGTNDVIVDDNGGYVDASRLKFIVGGILGEKGGWAYQGGGDHCTFDVEKSGAIKGFFRTSGDDFTITNHGSTAGFAFAGEGFRVEN